MKLFVFLFISLSFLFTTICFAPYNEKRTHGDPNELRTPEDEQAGFNLPDDFVIELIASERDGVVNPIDLTFDDAGRLWTQTAKMYPLDPIAEVKWHDLLRLMDDTDAQKNHPSFKRILDLYRGKTKGVDKILVITDFYGSDRHPKTTVWADSLTIPMSILPYKDGVYVAQGSELFFLNDSNKDSKADQRIPLLTGFGFVDTHTMAHVLTRGPGDWIYFSHGALNKGKVTSLTSDAKVNINYSKIARFSLDAKKINLVTSGLNNIWGFQLRNTGQWYATEANDKGFSIVPMEPGTGFPGIGNDRLHMYQPWMPELHKFRVGGTGISGAAFADDISGSFPSEWKDIALLANPITSTINAVKIVRNPDGTVTAKHLSDLLTSEDKFFRPVNIEFGPDGCLYVADWYDKVISHNEVSRTDPNRDKSYGRIWRIRHKKQKSYVIPNFYKIRTEELVEYLKSPSLWMKRSAWHQISDRPANETRKLASSLVVLAGDKSQDQITRIHALWSLEGIKHYNEKLMTDLLSAHDDDLRREAVRSLISFSLDPAQTAKIFSILIEDPNPMVRSQVLRTIYEMGNADTSTIDILVHASKPELPGNEMGGAYERKFERYLALKALEKYQKQLQTYLKSNRSSHHPVTNLLWAAQALPKDLREKKFLSLWPSANMSQLDESTFIMISKMLSNKSIYNTVKPVFQNLSNAITNLQLALKNQQQVQSAQLSSILEIPVQQALKSYSETDRQIALDAIARLNIKSSQVPIVSMINHKTSPGTLNLVLKALENNPQTNKKYFIRILENDNFDYSLRISALNSLSKADSVIALDKLEKLIPKATYEQKKTLVDILSGSSQGSKLLLHVFNKKIINIESFNISAAERIYNGNLNKKVAKVLVEQARKQDEIERRARINKHAKYLSFLQKERGNAEKGKVLFQSTCLMCHKVGDKGQDIAPALDGSSTRNNEALLTAILNPDAAVEGGYALYRVTRNDNSTVEGYLYNKNERGTTIAFMGGGKIFIETAGIKDQGFLGNRSFMPKGLIDGYTDDQVADLFAYIRTLK